MFRFTRSLAGRVTLLATLAVGFSVAFMALAAFFTVGHQLQATMDRSLLERAFEAAKTPAINELLGGQQVNSALIGAADLKIGFLYSNGRSLTADTDPQGPIPLGTDELAVARGKAAYSLRTITTSNDADYRVAAVPSAQSGVALVLAQSLRSTTYTLDRLGLVLVVFGGAGVLASALAGWAVARSGLRPVRALTDATEKIARTERLEPIAVEGNDEVARLAGSFNAMLLALSASRDRQRQLVADAGHELRTPLTSLRTNLELLDQADSQGGLDRESRSELLGDVRFQIEELTTLIGDLTELAREETVEVEVEAVDLAEIVDRAVQRVRRRGSNLAFDVDAETWWVTGEPPALERAITNLLDNAAKWSPPLGTVTVRCYDGTVFVGDQGHGIAEADLPHVFDRFYRSPTSRAMPGSGLGLSIVWQVAERHGGEVTAGRTAEGGAEFRFFVPGSNEPAEATPASRETGLAELRADELPTGVWGPAHRG